MKSPSLTSLHHLRMNSPDSLGRTTGRGGGRTRIVEFEIYRYELYRYPNGNSS